jgi:hypothetical protein
LTVGYTFLIKSCKLDSSGPMASGRMDRKCWLRCGFVCKVTPSTMNKWPCNRDVQCYDLSDHIREILLFTPFKQMLRQVVIFLNSFKKISVKLILTSSVPNLNWDCIQTNAKFDLKLNKFKMHWIDY